MLIGHLNISIDVPQPHLKNARSDKMVPPLGTHEYPLWAKSRHLRCMTQLQPDIAITPLLTSPTFKVNRSFKVNQSLTQPQILFGYGRDRAWPRRSSWTLQHLRHPLITLRDLLTLRNLFLGRQVGRKIWWSKRFRSAPLRLRMMLNESDPPLHG